MNTKLNGVQLIAAERTRQIEDEGWSLEHDDQHSNGELASAAAVYAVPITLYRDAQGDEHQDPHGLIPDRDGFYWAFRYIWPFGEEWLKRTPDDRVRELTKAGALIAAEIDRLMRISTT